MKKLSKIVIMRRSILIFVGIALLVLLLTKISYAYVINGDVSDWGINLSLAQYKPYLDNNPPSGGLDIDYVTEDNADTTDGKIKVGPGYSYGNTYDAEAMYFDNDASYGYIVVINGLASGGAQDPNNSSLWWDPGDIAIDFGTDGGYGYEYGIDISTGDLYQVSGWSDVYYGGHSDANPWEIKTGTDIGDVTLAYSTTAINGHYVIETSFLLADLGLSPGDSLGIHWTQECGNDELELTADVDPVPEPATMLLLGSGLIGLAALGRKKFFKKA